MGGVNVLTFPPGIGVGSVSASNATTGKFIPLGGPVTSSSTGAPAGPKFVLHEEISPPPAGTVYGIDAVPVCVKKALLAPPRHGPGSDDAKEPRVKADAEEAVTASSPLTTKPIIAIRVRLTTPPPLGTVAGDDTGFLSDELRKGLTGPLKHSGQPAL